MSKIVIIGSSISGFSACLELTKKSGHEITLISKEESLPYNGALLIDYLTSKIKKDELFFSKEDFFIQNKINFLRSSVVVRLDTRKQKVVLKDNSKIDYDYLIIASGQKIEIPDLPGKSKEGVFGFYSLEDAEKIKKRLVVSDTACIFGINSNALKLADFFVSKACDVKIISKDSQPFDFVDKDKIECINMSSPVEFIGEGELQAVKLSSGKVIGTSLACFCEGFMPQTEFLKNSGVELIESYVLVDDCFRSNIENIFASGSCARKKDSSLIDKDIQACSDEGKFAAINLFERGKALCQTS